MYFRRQFFPFGQNILKILSTILNKIPNLLIFYQKLGPNFAKMIFQKFSRKKFKFRSDFKGSPSVKVSFYTNIKKFHTTIWLLYFHRIFKICKASKIETIYLCLWAHTFCTSFPKYKPTIRTVYLLFVLYLQDFASHLLHQVIWGKMLFLLLSPPSHLLRVQWLEGTQIIICRSQWVFNFKPISEVLFFTLSWHKRSEF